jgi:hypothetical protein
MKYLCLAYEAQGILDGLSRAEWEELRQETLDYAESLRASGHLIVTEPLKSASTAVTVRVRHGKTATTDGPFAETKEQLGGIFLIEARDMNQALHIAERWPSARFGSIEVRPVEAGLRPEGRYEDVR